MIECFCACGKVSCFEMAPMPVQSSSSGANGASGGKQTTSSSSAMSSFMCCTSERSGKTYSYREQSAHTTSSSSNNQSKFLWLDPTRWVEKRTVVKKEKVGFREGSSNPSFLRGNCGRFMTNSINCLS